MNLSFYELTLELLKHKYRYYLLGRPTISDAEYDRLEAKREAMLKEQGIDPQDEENWVDFPWGHPMADEAEAQVLSEQKRGKK